MLNQASIPGTPLGHDALSHSKIFKPISFETALAKTSKVATLLNAVNTSQDSSRLPYQLHTLDTHSPLLPLTDPVIPAQSLLLLFMCCHL